MPRAQTVSIENNFSKGLITEASGLNFPENSCTETWNCIFDETGKVSRRKGFALETGATMTSLDTADVTVNEYVWKSVAGSGDIIFVVVQVGGTLHFYLAGDGATLTDGKKSFTVSLSTFKVSGSPSVSALPCSFASGNGSLFVAHPYCEPFYVEYDTDADTISTTELDITVRDLIGADDGLEVDDRPSTLSNPHLYNLYNQGWPDEDIRVQGATKRPHIRFEDFQSVYPANCDIWWLMKNSAGLFHEDQVRQTPTTDTPAPKGHYKFNAFNIDRTTVLSGTDTQTSSYFRPKSISFFAGRIWYAGVDYAKYNNKIYFSQVILENDDAEKCYQLNDPSAENLFDLLDTDGGEITIPEAGTIVKLFATQNSLIVFASNGVWSISGSEGIGFIATDYSVTKLSSVGSLSSTTFCDVDGFPLWWNLDGIYGVSINEAGSLSVGSISDGTIQTFYDALPGSSKTHAKGVYNSLEKVVVWLFRSSEEASISDRYYYDRALFLNVKSGAFYPWAFSNTGDEIVQGVVSVDSIQTTETLSDVVDSGGETVVDSSAETVISSTSVVTNAGSVFKFTYFDDGDTELGFAETSSASYTDWGIDANTYESYFITGYRIRGDAIRHSSIEYLFVYMTDETSASCYVQPVWDYATNGNSGRYGSKQQVFLARENRNTQVRKLLIRGQGRSVQFKFTSDAKDKPFEIIGWGAFESAEQLP